MATSVHVQGAASIWINYGSGLLLMGYSENGVTMNFEQKEQDIFTDQFGQGVPNDVIFLGQEGTVDIELLSWDWAVLDRAITLIKPRTTPGTLVATDYGCLYAKDGLTIALRISGTKAGEYIWDFPVAYLQSVQSLTVGTRESRWSLTFRTLPASSLTLYTRTLIS